MMPYMCLSLRASRNIHVTEEKQPADLVDLTYTVTIALYECTYKHEYLGIGSALKHLTLVMLVRSAMFTPGLQPHVHLCTHRWHPTQFEQANRPLSVSEFTRT